MTLRRAALAACLAAMASVTAPPVASAHPLGNYTVNRAVVVEIGGKVDVRYVIDMAEIPAFEAIQQIDTDDDAATGPAEVARWAATSCADVSAALTVAIDGDGATLREGALPALTFPAGAGGLETLRLVCAFVVDATIDPDTDHELAVADGSDDGRVGWREVTAVAGGAASISESDVPSSSASAELTRYPEDGLQTPLDVRSAELTFRIGADTSAWPPAPAAPTSRVTSTDPLASLVGGDLAPPIVVLAMLLALGLGAVHALSPGHGKTLVAAYVLGAGGGARSAMQIGLSVAASHTAGVLALGVLTLLASELFLPERVIGWLSLVSGVVVAGLGAVLLVRQVRGWGGRQRGHTHGHGHDHAHDDGHSHAHEPASGELSWRSALALGFAGGVVPSASAVIVLLVAISTDRLAFGVLLIAMFGVGMAIVLGGLGLVIARVGRAAAGAERGILASPGVRRIGAWVPAIAAVVVLVSGLAFALTAFGQLS